MKKWRYIGNYLDDKRKLLKMVCKECGKEGHTSKTCLTKYKNIERVTSNEECSICLTKTNKPKCKTSCSHTFHVTCLKEWLKTSITCPLCRKTLNDDKGEILCILIDAIMNRMEEIEDIYLLANPGLVEDVVESYFENENLI